MNSEASLLLTTHAIDYQAQICAPQGRKSYLLRKKMVQERKEAADIITTISTLMSTQVMSVPQLNGSFRSVNKLLKKLFKLAS